MLTASNVFVKYSEIASGITRNWLAIGGVLVTSEGSSEMSW